MMDNRLFLFLDSPRVGNIGHSFVVAPDPSVPPEKMLTYLATRARSQCAEGGGGSAALHRVEQITRGMARAGDELLICGGVEPARLADKKVVQEVLGELLRMLPDGQLKTDAQIGPLVHGAKWMEGLSERFRADPRVAGIKWTSIEEVWLEHAPHQNLPARPTLCSGFQRLPLFMRVPIYIVFAIVLILPFVGDAQFFSKPAGHAGTETGSGASAKPTPRKVPTLEKWAFLTKDDWPRLLTVSGAPKLAGDLAKLLEPAETKSVSGFMRMWDTSKDSKSSLAADGPCDEKVALVNAQISEWAKRIVEEFELPNQDAIQSSPTLEALMKAEGTSGADVAAWFRDTKNQRRTYSPELKKAADTLQDFADSFQGSLPGELPEKLRKSVADLTAFAKSSVAGADRPKPFQAVMSDALSKFSPPPSGYQVLTLKDAGRIKVLQSVGWIASPTPRAQAGGN